MADLALLEDAQAPLRREKAFRDRSDLLSESDDWLLSCFRLSRHVLVQLFAKLEPQLGRETRRSRAISVPLQVLWHRNRHWVSWPPGSTHDAFIFQHSSVGRRLEKRAPRGDGYLLPPPLSGQRPIVEPQMCGVGKQRLADSVPRTHLQSLPLAQDAVHCHLFLALLQ
uniref:Uncharacterized protein n=1 Tax=Knipowitschia caucasica TaxID=637954 RepID=A0AAV2MFG2_KNICA